MEYFNMGPPFIYRFLCNRYFTFQEHPKYIPTTILRGGFDSSYWLQIENIKYCKQFTDRGKPKTWLRNLQKIWRSSVYIAWHSIPFFWRNFKSISEQLYARTGHTCTPWYFPFLDDNHKMCDPWQESWIFNRRIYENRNLFHQTRGTKWETFSWELHRQSHFGKKG